MNEMIIIARPKGVVEGPIRETSRGCLGLGVGLGVFGETYSRFTVGGFGGDWGRFVEYYG